MRPLSSLTPEVARSIQGVAFDLDDTFLSHGTLTKDAYDALHDLQDAGLKLAVVTGRPAGWGEVIARQWPVDGVIVENGALYLRRERRDVVTHDPCSAKERQSRRIRLARLAADVRERVREAKVTGDAGARISDVTWDLGETQIMPEAQIRIMREMCLDAGARVTTSSIHLHASFDGADKASGLMRFAKEVFDHDETLAKHVWAFLGDSPNDAPCFSGLETTFGVANVRKYVKYLSAPPKYVASEEMGLGFAEIVDTLLRARRKGREFDA